MAREFFEIYQDSNKKHCFRTPTGICRFAKYDSAVAAIPRERVRADKLMDQCNKKYYDDMNKKEDQRQKDLREARELRKRTMSEDFVEESPINGQLFTKMTLSDQSKIIRMIDGGFTKAQIMCVFDINAVSLAQVFIHREKKGMQ